ncbi:MAG: sigma-70 family RNA polymerase sigma factor [Candidatus Uhrbacteria bacterium]|nr:sigma-70 family RNA polymerase sigma factor [Candidatus Uhrbacteria bacterium]
MKSSVGGSRSAFRTGRQKEPFQRLDVGEEQRLARLWQKHEDAGALEQLVKAHLRLVIKIAMEFRYSRVDMDDLIQQGNFGLVIAARRFDPHRGSRLATYAAWWIRAYMLAHIRNTYGPVRIGTTTVESRIFFGLGKARGRLEFRGEEVTSAALAHELGVSAIEVERMTPRLTGRDISLDAPMSPFDARSVSSRISDPCATPEESVGESEEYGFRRAKILKGLEILDPREQAIIRDRHLSRDAATLSTLGKKWGISRERARQIEERALGKLHRFCKRER